MCPTGCTMPGSAFKIIFLVDLKKKKSTGMVNNLEKMRERRQMVPVNQHVML